MKRYEYLEEVKNDVVDYIKENFEEGDIINTDRLYDDLFCEDSITGNASGSYYFNSYKAFEALGADVQEIAEEIEAEFGPIPAEKAYNWEFLDVSYRCLLLSEAIEEAKKELYFNYHFE